MSTDTSSTVDLRSDTLTKPTAAMRATMAGAEVGDDVFGEDPSVNALQQRVAQLLGKEAALYVPSGTMANLLCVLSQTAPGDTVILSEDAHPYNYESGNLAMVGGVSTRTVKGPLGTIEAWAIEACIVKTDDHHFSPTTLISIEHTTNRGGGNLYSLESIADIRALADTWGLKVHCDGARLFNAVAASGISAAEYARDVDTVCFCFSKGLGAPVGSILAGPADTVDRAHRFRKMLGGGMRQAGILAAAANYALDHHVDRLAEDQERARTFREALEETPGIAFPMPTPTNIVIFDVEDGQRFVDLAKDGGVLLIAMGPRRVRAVFHLDIDDDGLSRAIEICKGAAL